MRSEFAFFQETQNLGGVVGADHRTKADRAGIRRGNHHAQATDQNPDHEVTFGPTVEHTVTYLFNNTDAVIWIHDFIADLIVHKLWLSP
jgi:hypothetical protein